MDSITSEAIVAFVLLDLFTVACVVAWILHRNARRWRGLGTAAAELGLATAPTDEPLAHQLSNLPLFRQASRWRVRNVLSDNNAELDVRIFDCAVTIRGDHDYATFVQTVVTVQSSDLGLPTFAWWTDAAIKLLSEPLRMTEINNLRGFESTGHRLFSGDAPVARELFHAELIGRLEAFPELCVEGDGDMLCMYRIRQLASPANLRDRLLEGIELFGTIRKALSEQMEMAEDATARAN